MRPDAAGRARQVVRWGLASMFLVAGTAHFSSPDPFLQHLPPWVPAPGVVNYAAGAVELLLGVTLLAWRARRQLVGRLAAGFLLLVFPGNIYVAVADVDVAGLPDGPWLWLRLLLQPALVAGALWSTRRYAPAAAPPAGDA